MASPINLDSLLRPKSVAIVGASDDRSRFGGAALHNMLSHGYAGKIFPVTRSGREVMGLPSTSSLSEIGQVVDSVVVIVSADAALPVVREAAELGVGSAIVVASGFGEGNSGADGMDRLTQLHQIVDNSNLVVLGPSTTGLTNLFDSYVPRASSNQLSPESVKYGSLALISQSGAVNNILYNRAQASGVGVGYAVATGVQGFLNVWDVVAHVIEDPRIRVVAMALEDAGPGLQAMKVCRRAQQLGTSIVAVKLGRTDQGAVAIRSHSGTLAGNWTVERSYLQSAGVIFADDLDELWELGLLVDRWGRRSAVANPSLGVLAFSGGDGALVADQAADIGLEMPVPSLAFVERIRSVAPLADVNNPFDPTGDVIGREEEFVECVRSFVEENDYSAFLIAAPIQGELLRRPMRLACEAVHREGLRVAASLWSVRGVSDGVELDLRSDGFPLFDTSHRAVAAIAKYLAPDEGVLSRDLITTNLSAEVRSSIAAIDGASSYWEARTALHLLGVPFPSADTAGNSSDAAAVATGLGFPVVVKGNVRNDTHKSASGFVRLGLRNAHEVAEATTDMLRTMVDAGYEDPRVVVERFVFGNAQLYVGATRESDFGPAVIVGAGGFAVESSAGVAIAPSASIDAVQALALIKRTPIGKLIGSNASVLTAVADVVVLVAAAIQIDGRVGIDINPLVIDMSKSRIVAADARII